MLVISYWINGDEEKYGGIVEYDGDDYIFV